MLNLIKNYTSSPFINVHKLIPALLVVFGVVYTLLAANIELDSWSQDETINSKTLPIIYGATFTILCIPLLFQKSKNKAVPKFATRLAPLIAIIVIFGTLIPYVGLWISLVFLLIFSLIVLGERRATVLLLAPLFTALCGYLLIEIGLNIYIDSGSLWSNW